MDALPAENVQDYPRPPALEPAGAVLRVEVGGEVIAETARGLRVLETHHAPSYYFPPEDVRMDLLRPASGRTFCEWKGVARYWDIVVGSHVAAAAAWAYDRPGPRFAALAGYVAFYAGKVDAAFVGETRVLAQPGSFYGGWVTPNLQGIVKGGLGTEGW